MTETPMVAMYEVADGRLSVQTINEGQWVEVTDLGNRPLRTDEPGVVADHLNAMLNAADWTPSDDMIDLDDVTAEPIANGWHEYDEGNVWVRGVRAA